MKTQYIIGLILPMFLYQTLLNVQVAVNYLNLKFIIGNLEGWKEGRSGERKQLHYSYLRKRLKTEKAGI